MTGFILNKTNTKNDIYVYVTNVVGKARLFYEYICNDNVVFDSSPTTEQFIAINLDHARSHFAKHPRGNSYSVRIIVKNVNAKTGTYVFSIMSSKLDYRKLLLGYPTDFYIRKNSTLVF